LVGFLGYWNGTLLTTAVDGSYNGLTWLSFNGATGVDASNQTLSYLPAVTNVLQLLISAIRLDWGVVLPNNPYVNKAAVNATLQNPLGAGNYDWSVINELSAFYNGTSTDPWFANLVSDSPTYLNAQYLCRFSYRLGWARATVNVLVATFSLFSTGWGLTMFAVAWFAKKSVKDGTDGFCEGHAAVRRGDENVPGLGVHPEHYGGEKELLADSEGV